jgi:hypothetical protein
MACIRQLASSIACLSQGFKVPATTGVQRKDRRVKSAEVPTNVKEVVTLLVKSGPLNFQEPRSSWLPITVPVSPAIPGEGVCY